MGYEVELTDTAASQIRAQSFEAQQEIYKHLGYLAAKPNVARPSSFPRPPGGMYYMFTFDGPDGEVDYTFQFRFKSDEVTLLIELLGMVYRPMDW